MQIHVYRKKGAEDECNVAFANTILYWCNGCGELHDPHNNLASISEDELPACYRNAYQNFCGDGVYLVETPAGHGVALLYQYNEFFTEEYGLSMPALFDSALQDTITLAGLPELQDADLYLGEFAFGGEESHELVVVFPADIEEEQFRAAYSALDKHVFSNVRTQRDAEAVPNPCPVCGSKKVQLERQFPAAGSDASKVYTYVCTDCGLRASIQADSVAMADTIWNTRVATRH